MYDLAVKALDLLAYLEEVRDLILPMPTTATEQETIRALMRMSRPGREGSGDGVKD